MNKKVGTKEILSGAVILTLVLLIGYIYFITLINKNTRQVSDLVLSLTQETRKESQLRSVEALLVDTRDLREEINASFIEKNRVVDFIQEVEALAELSGLTIEIDTVGVESTEGNLKEILERVKMEINMVGSWSEFMHFTSLLEATPYHLNVERIATQKVPRGEGRSNEGLWEGVINIEALKEND